MEPKLFQLKSDLNYPVVVELYFGFELKPKKDYYNGYYFYFLQIPSYNVVFPEYPEVPKNEDFDYFDKIEKVIWHKYIKEDLGTKPLKKYGISFDQVWIKDFEDLTSIYQFNPKGFCKDYFSNLKKVIKDKEFYRKLKILKKEALKCPQAKVGIDLK